MHDRDYKRAEDDDVVEDSRKFKGVDLRGGSDLVKELKGHLRRI